jgi:predicted dehydrogenase
VAVADRDTRRCAQVAPDLPAFPSAAELVTGCQLDAMIVATPPADHVQSARVAAGAGLPCLVEKPPAGDAAGARELAALEPAPWIGFNRRFEPALGELRSRLPPAERIRLVLEFGYDRTAWGARDGSADALLDVGVHLVDLARWLTGSNVVGVRAHRIEELEAELELELDRGTASISCGVDRSYRERVDVRPPAVRRGAAAPRRCPPARAVARARARGVHSGSAQRASTLARDGRRRSGHDGGDRRRPCGRTNWLDRGAGQDRPLRVPTVPRLLAG